ncbi:unnamed protein product [Eruca vesicaria subsp. sativa]|uniref:Factor of DNA methylation 1-5/IDN2 domain-containing protein n=1 Tax=Eruca vesicaria subsp. sativa TaxID=29727 RepID=A0ABC8JJ63_ERUVS|nr:unnamed protein product [Eruca vesicaria subsp. sativa]
MDAVHELQRKINDYERKRFHYERKISRLEDDLFQRDQEIIRAKFTILQALPGLNTPENGPLVDIVRVPGYLDPKMFETACLKACLNNPSDGREGESTRKDRAILDAETLCNEWRSKTSNGLWRLYTEVPEQGGEEDNWIQVEAEDLLDVKEKYGEELYKAIKIAWTESKEGRRTGVQLKPWDYEAGREKTLTELLVPLREQIQFLTMKTSEEGK